MIKPWYVDSSISVAPNTDRIKYNEAINRYERAIEQLDGGGKEKRLRKVKNEKHRMERLGHACCIHFVLAGLHEDYRGLHCLILALLGE